MQGSAESSLPAARRRQTACMPLTPAILERMRHRTTGPRAETRTGNCTGRCLHALCYFGFFRLGELLLPTEAPSRALLRWGDVTFNHASQPTLLKIHLHVAKCDQFGEGTDVFIGKTGNAICPVDACLAYVAIMQGRFPRSFLQNARFEVALEIELRVGSA